MTRILSRLAFGASLAILDLPVGRFRRARRWLPGRLRWRNRAAGRLRRRDWRSGGGYGGMSRWAARPQFSAGMAVDMDERHESTRSRNRRGA